MHITAIEVDGKRVDFSPGAEAANETPPPRKYLVTIKKGGTVVRHFEAVGSDAVGVATQHEGQCGEGEYVRVSPLGEPADDAEREARYQRIDQAMHRDKVQNNHVTNAASPAYERALADQQSRLDREGKLWPLSGGGF
jgi:hypothetical protein